MKIGPKYKIARRLGAPVFEKTQTQKFTLSQAKKASEIAKKKKRMSKKTDFGMQMLEKQKARFTYLLSEKQFSNYTKKALSQKQVTDKASLLFELLEKRLDSVTFRIGLAPTRMSARQFVSHGHIMVNGRRVTIPSFEVKVGDKISIKPSSLEKGNFNNLKERLKEVSTPYWIKLDIEKLESEIIKNPELQKADTLFDLKLALEFYSR